MSIRGIDVSDYQPNINWQAVANDGISFAFVKSTEGVSFVAESFARNWAAMKAVGIQRGAYHFFRPSSSVKGQIDSFLKTVKPEPGDLPPVLDIETTGDLGATEVCDRMAQWLEAVETETHLRPIIYTYPGFWSNLGTTRFNDYPLWIAHYTTASEPWVPGGWGSWTFWQYTDSGRVAGVAGKVDVNLFESLEPGTKGAKVQEIQKNLKNKGFYQGNPDGDFGNTTKSAVISFQKAKGLEADGIAGLKTWAALVSKFPGDVIPSPTPSPTPLPAPVPAPTPSPVISSPIIRLTDVCKSYQGKTNQDISLIWLQSQIPASTMSEFSQRWRNEFTPQAQVTPVRLLDVCKFYRGLPNQDQALEWLQSQLSVTILTDFAQRWRSQIITPTPAPAPIPTPTPTPPTPIPAIRLLDVCKFYRGYLNQDQALEWLQRQIPPDTLAEFARRWRTINRDN